ncbi:MAG: 16S rRNA processing protein RimM [Owenweeksia sp.]|nr:16S rRNA processing protein RimM [Owenweeksia sp.]MBF99985.1 16S rRNA processing protein RimM [Owenweeksia sp.]HBF18921.1 16S rRNA processing protein RimM [Cryomorphaceae bacterium]|tara:strand:- start:1 stop:534 length:534 start_codon:yes stop_codon:yes gene_type:complete
MRKEDCFYLGHISRKHGYKGEVIAVFDTDQKENYTALESVLLDIHGELIPFFIEEMAMNSKGHFILGLEDVVTDEDAEKLIGRELYLPLEVLPPLSGKSFYFHEVIGFSMVDAEAGPIGTCMDIIDQSAQPIFQIDKDGTEILVPAVDEFIQSIDRDTRTIYLQTPPGLLDIYLDGQ